MHELTRIEIDESNVIRAECPAHGPYQSKLWKMEHSYGVTTTMWTGCPKCVLEAFRKKYGFGKPTYRIPHRHSYRSEIFKADGSSTIDWPELAAVGRLPPAIEYEAEKAIQS